MKIAYKRYDLTVLPPRYVIAHCVSCDCAMGAGVALAVRKRFPCVKSCCKSFACSQSALGRAYRVKDEKFVIYNLFTKKHWWQHAGEHMTHEEYLDNLRDALEDMKNQMLYHGENTLGIPLLGCGLDKCQWADVEKILQDVFGETDINILACKY